MNVPGDTVRESFLQRWTQGNQAVCDSQEQLGLYSRTTVNMWVLTLDGLDYVPGFRFRCPCLRPLPCLTWISAPTGLLVHSANPPGPPRIVTSFLLPKPGPIHATLNTSVKESVIPISILS